MFRKVQNNAYLNNIIELPSVYQKIQWLDSVKTICLEYFYFKTEKKYR